MYFLEVIYHGTMYVSLDDTRKVCAMSSVREWSVQVLVYASRQEQWAV
jgi:hypothetical protein